VLAHLTEQQRRAHMLADNRLAELATWDQDKLAAELGELSAAGVSVAELGWTSDDLQRLLNRSMAEADDLLARTPVAVEARAERGSIWKLGPHRLMCGDSSAAEDVDALLAGAPVHLVNMDPPYNVKVEPRSNNAIAAGLSSFTATHHEKFDVARFPSKAKPTGKMRAKDRPLQNDFVSTEGFDAMLLAWFGNAARVLLPGRAFYIWGGYANSGNYPAALAASGLYYSQAIIWVKEHPVLTRKDFMGNHEWCFHGWRDEHASLVQEGKHYKRGHEWCLYGWREGGAHSFLGPANVPDVWTVKKVAPQQMVHLTEKPVELALRAIQYSSRKGENVLDLFGGSGSTLAACQASGRNAYLMEIDEPYCDVILERWGALTGIEPVLVSGHRRARARDGARRR
jgi:DNA modification methylase